MIERVLTQLGFSNRLQGIITQSDLERWYAKCLSAQYKEILGVSLLQGFQREFLCEFPSTGEAFSKFMIERGYNQIQGAGVFVV